MHQTSSEASLDADGSHKMCECEAPGKIYKYENGKRMEITAP